MPGWFFSNTLSSALKALRSSAPIQVVNFKFTAARFARRTPCAAAESVGVAAMATDAALPSRNDFLFISRTLPTIGCYLSVASWIVRAHRRIKGGPPIRLGVLPELRLAGVGDLQLLARAFGAAPHGAAVTQLWDQPAPANLRVQHFVGPIVVLKVGQQTVADGDGRFPLVAFACLAAHQALLDVIEHGVALQRSQARVDGIGVGDGHG